MVDMESEVETREQVTNLSIFGCQVATRKPFLTGTKIRLRIIHRGAVFAALGHVANIRANSIGIVFTGIEQKEQVVLEKWLAEARDTHERTSTARKSA